MDKPLKTTEIYLVWTQNHISHLCGLVDRVRLEMIKEESKPEPESDMYRYLQGEERRLLELIVKLREELQLKTDLFNQQKPIDTKEKP